jgi:hypothetical protein
MIRAAGKIMHRSLVRTGIAAIVALAIFQFSGCGGGGSSSNRTGSPFTI